jgi:DNA-binding CsgD family transcriptional regulator
VVIGGWWFTVAQAGTAVYRRGVLVDGDLLGPDHEDPQSFRLSLAVADMYADLRVTPILRRLLTHSQMLLGTVAGSISLTDAAAGRYAKIAEAGVGCQLGHSFPLDEGATGRAFARRRPVVIDSYADLAAGHLPREHAASRGTAAAVPLWWRGDVIGVNVAFAGRRRGFSTAEVDAFEALTQSVAAALLTAGAGDPSLSRLLREQARVDAEDVGVRTVVTEAGAVRPVSAEAAAAAVDLVALAGRAAAQRHPSARLHVALVYRPEGLRLLVQDETVDVAPAPTADPLGLGTRTWEELVSLVGGAVGVEPVPGWGTLLRADLPYATSRVPASPAEPTPPVEPPPLTRREAEVLGLMAHGLSNQQLAGRLVLSPKTIEKHVGAVLRKTGAASRTAAVMLALERGWLPRDAGPTDGHGT